MNAPAPNFFVIGAPKAATTSLCSQLADHPDVFMSSPKELRYFNGPDKSRERYNDYLAHFAMAEGYKAIGEGSVTYSLRGLFPGTPRRIAANFPDARFIYAVREPISRIESHWMEWRKHGLSDTDIERAVLTDASLIDGSRYWYQLKAYFEYFDPNQILVVFYEDYQRDPMLLLEQICQFLEIGFEGFKKININPRNVSVGSRIDTALGGC